MTTGCDNRDLPRGSAAAIVQPSAREGADGQAAHADHFLSPALRRSDGLGGEAGRAAVMRLVHIWSTRDECRLDPLPVSDRYAQV